MQQSRDQSHFRPPDNWRPLLPSSEPSGSTFVGINPLEPLAVLVKYGCGSVMTPATSIPVKAEFRRAVVIQKVLPPKRKYVETQRIAGGRPDISGSSPNSV